MEGGLLPWYNREGELMDDAIGKNVKYYREKLRISQEILAEKCNVSASCVSRWESGHWRPSKENQIKLAEIFGIPVAALYLPQTGPPQSLLAQQISEIVKELSLERQEFLLDMARGLKRLP